MDHSDRLSLPFILPNQAQKHVTLNEALMSLDVLVQATVVSRSLGIEPAAPLAGDVYILPAGASGAGWAGKANGTIAAYTDAGWRYFTPQEGWVAYSVEDGATVRYLSGSWSVETVGSGEVSSLGVNTQSGGTDTRLSVKSDYELLSHDDQTPGSGNARKLINKAASDKVASVVFQSQASGRAEFGLVGEDALTVKVSPDGTTFSTATRFDPATARVSFPSGVAEPTTGQLMPSLLPLQGGDGLTSIFRIDASRRQNPRGDTIAALTASSIQLTSADTATFYRDAMMAGVSMARIWNTSRSPIEPAWIVGAPDSSTLNILDPASITSWQVGDTIQLGDPTSVTGGRVIALDISPMMQATLGTVVRQSGILVKLVAGASGADDCGIELTPDGMSGSFLGTRSYAGESSAAGQLMMMTPVASPVSQSNLAFVRETAFGSQVKLSIVSAMGLYV